MEWTEQASASPQTKPRGPTRKTSLVLPHLHVLDSHCTSVVLTNQESIGSPSVQSPTMSSTKSRAEIDTILSAIPHKARGPGGSAAVIKDGEVVSQLSWGYANLEQRVPMSATTVLPICSISKQMVCLAMTSLCRNPTPAMLMKDQSPWELMTAEMKRLLPHLDGHPDGELRLEHLFNMQSGIRDYWVM